MENTKKVFCTEIIRDEKQFKNNLYDLLNIVPATPLKFENRTSHTCNFRPKTDKVFIPKRRPRVKVKTVRDIRALFESDIYSYLTKDLKTQHDYVLQKIKNGFSNNEKTIKMAKTILQASSPISRSCWQMLTNINPDNQKNTHQFVLWNGNFIQVNGSIGGKNKLICNHDLAFTKLLPKVKNKSTKNINAIKRKGLLRNSLAIKFKPGPLGKKKLLDDSHQKFNGDIELVELPKVGLDIQPAYGTTLDSTIMPFLRNLKKDDGTMSKKWAEFAVSAIGKIDTSNAKLLSSECMTFDLNYKCNQHKILMRKDLDAFCFIKENRCPQNVNLVTAPVTSTLPVIKCIMNKILDAIEISMSQDNMYSPNEEVYETNSEESNPKIIPALSKERTKKKYCELEKLDVTIIRLTDNSVKKSEFTCQNLYCTLGCVCDSLKNSCNFRQHCGREECMFDCKCEFSKHTNISALDVYSSSSIPETICIDDENNIRLAKEEQKFHQTIIVAGEKNILLKSDKRNVQSTKKYENFYNNMSSESNKKKRILSVTALKINCENVEPWCLVHNLYKCFCKGIFTQNNSLPSIQSLGEESSSKDIHANIEPFSEKNQNLTNNMSMKKSLRERVRPDGYSSDKTLKIKSYEDNISINSDKLFKGVYNSEYNSGRSKKSNIVLDTFNSDLNKVSRSISENDDEVDNALSDPCITNCSATCSRVTAYEGRKYSNGYYNNINDKIKNMEKNDKKLQQKILNILTKDSVTDNIITISKDTETLSTKETVKDNSPSQVKKSAQNLQIQTKIHTSEFSHEPNFIKFLYDIDGLRSGDEISKEKRQPIDNRLGTWLESNYKLYKKRIDEGLLKTSLEPPKVGKMALHSWDFILSRYRDRKNLFLISKQKPYRIFMAVHTRALFFQTCMNINEIRFADLYKYPQTVKNLLTNATHLKDNFCILRGCAHCWELVGSVAKISNDDENPVEINDNTSDSEPSFQCNQSDVESEQLSFGSPEKEDLLMHNSKDTEILSECSDEAETSKWFVMTVENDFSEIRFYKKGFFVKHESIVKAINVARVSGKTVRLSSQKCVDKTSGPQFGVYAIPNASEYCVFIGPYEIKDSLGIETIKTILDVKKIKRTRGFWIITNKIDNLKVIDNPMSFMPLTCLKNKDAVPIDNHFCEDKNADVESSKKPDSKVLDLLPKNSLVVKSNIKVKPIKIQKPQKLFQISSDGSLKGISLKNPRQMLSFSSTLNQKLRIPSESVLQSLISTVPDNNTFEIQHTMPSVSKDNCVEDDASQIKITAVYSQKDKSISKNERSGDRGMFILKPEEINRKLMKQQIIFETSSEQNIDANLGDDISNTKVNDISNIEVSDICAKNAESLDTCNLDENVYVISDDESDMTSRTNNDIACWRDVFIQCTNVTDRAWILGRHKPESNLLSFKVPGGEFSTFYPEQEAFQQLNYELSNIVDASCHFNLEWKIVDSTDGIDGEGSQTDVLFWRRVLANKGKQSSQNEMIINFFKNNAMDVDSKENTELTSGASPIKEFDGEVVLPDTEHVKYIEQENIEIEEISTVNDETIFHLILN